MLLLLILRATILDSTVCIQLSVLSQARPAPAPLWPCAAVASSTACSSSPACRARSYSSWFPSSWPSFLHRLLCFFARRINYLFISGVNFTILNVLILFRRFRVLRCSRSLARLIRGKRLRFPGCEQLLPRFTLGSLGVVSIVACQSVLDESACCLFVETHEWLRRTIFC